MRSGRAPGAAVALMCAAALSACGGEASGDRAPELPEGMTRDVPGAVLDGCRRAGRAYRGTVYCPPVVPAGGVEVNIAGPANRSARLRARSYLVDFASPSLGRVGGRRVDAHGGHWILAAGTDPALARTIRAPDAEKRPRVARRSLGDQAVDVVRLPPFEEGGGYFGGHVAVAWRRGGVTYQVSLHGDANAGRALAMARALIDLQRRCPAPRRGAGCEMALAGGGG